MTIILAIVVFALQLGDWWTTRTVLNRGGRELNPIAKWCMDRIGMDGFLCVKAIAAPAAGYAGGIYALVPIIAIYVWVVWHNWRAVRGSL